MNVFLFSIQTLSVVLFALFALKLGKRGLTAWVAIQALLANLFVLKQINLFGFEVTASDAYAIGSLLGLNFLQERYGKEEAQKASFITFFLMLYFAIASFLHLGFVPSIHDRSQEAFQTILSVAPRLIFSSLAVFFIVQQVDVRLFNFLQKTLPKAGFAVRSGITLAISQFLDTVLFSFAGLFGLVASLADIILISFLIKLAVIFSCSTMIRWVKA